jgi:dTDP-glucose 4,6-dehydratase
MRIFITGGCGFIGSNFVINQINKNHKIFNFDKLTYAANQDNLLEINQNSNYTFLKGDITDSKKLFFAIKEFNPNIIINFAAESHVDRSIDGPEEFISTNIIGTYKLLQCSLDYYDNLSKEDKNNFKFIHVSTDEVYGSLGKKGSFKEISPYKPSSPYSASKASSDHLVNAWHHTFNLPTIITNCSNNYGPYQFPEKLIPLIIISCLNGKELPIYGDGKNIRDWLYVKDHCTALDCVINNGKSGETYNIGGNEEKTNLDIVNTICSVLDKKMPLKNGLKYSNSIIYVKDRPGHDFRYAIDSSKIKNELNWQPQYQFESAIVDTIDWYIQNQSWWKKILNNKYDLNRLGSK